MELKKSIYLARKAAMLAEVTECTVDEAIRYIAVCETSMDASREEKSMITGLPIELVERLDGASMYFVLI